MSVERSAAIALVAIGLSSVLLLFAFGAAPGTSKEKPSALFDAPIGIVIDPTPPAELPAQRAAVPIAVQKSKPSAARSAASGTTDDAVGMRGLALPLSAV